MTAKGPVITTSRGSIKTNKYGKAELTWNVGFQPKWQKQYTKAQKFVDSEILRLSEPYTPLLTGTLIKSGILGTEVGSGTIKWIAPYARTQYYLTKQPGSATGPLRGPYWFERMKQAHGPKILEGAKQLGGGGHWLTP